LSLCNVCVIYSMHDAECDTFHTDVTQTQGTDVTQNLSIKYVRLLNRILSVRKGSIFSGPILQGFVQKRPGFFADKFFQGRKIL